MRIVQPAAQTWQAVGKTTVLRAAVLKTHLLVGSYHPAHGSSRFDTVAQSCQHPGSVSAHRPACAADVVGIHLGHLCQILRSGDVVIGHIGREINAVHHHIAGYHIIEVTFHAFFQPTLAPHRGIGREYYVALFGQIVAEELPVVAF